MMENHVLIAQFPGQCVQLKNDHNGLHGTLQAEPLMKLIAVADNQISRLSPHALLAAHDLRFSPDNIMHLNMLVPMGGKISTWFLNFILKNLHWKFFVADDLFFVLIDAVNCLLLHPIHAVPPML